MASGPKIQGFQRSGVQALSDFKRDPGWMTDLRLTAWDAFEKMGGFAALRDFSNDGIVLEELASFIPPPQQAVPSREWPADLSHALEERGDEEGLIVQRDCTILSKAISKEQSKRGAIFCDLETALKTAPALVRKYIQRRLASAEEALNMAFWTGGSFLYVPEHVEIKLPFHHCLWLTTAGAAMFPRSLIVAEKGSQISFLEECLSPAWDTPSVSLSVSDVVAAERAKIFCIDLKNWGPRVMHRERRNTDLAETGQLFSLRIGRGGHGRREVLEVEWSDSQTKELVQRQFGSSEADTATLFFETVFARLPPGTLVEKLRHIITGKFTGHRPILTLEKVAELHPEVRV